jgi:hypothetical protein
MVLDYYRSSKNIEDLASVITKRLPMFYWKRLACSASLMVKDVTIRN